MSFTPQIIIDKKSLEKERDTIESKVYNEKKDDVRAAYKELEKALAMEPIVFPKMEIVIIQPELSSPNERVRRLLMKLDVTFRLNC